MARHKKFEEARQAYQNKCRDEGLEKLETALKKQPKSKTLNKSKLSRDSGLSRPTIERYINNFPELFAPWKMSKSNSVIMLEEQVKLEKKKNQELRKENTRLQGENKKQSDRIVELTALLNAYQNQGVAKR